MIAGNMNGKTSLTKKILIKGWSWEVRVDKYLARVKPLSMSEYFKFLGLIFIFSGFGLFFYCMIFRYNILDLHYTQCPLFYLILGIVCFFIVFLLRKS